MPRVNRSPDEILPRAFGQLEWRATQLERNVGNGLPAGRIYVTGGSQVIGGSGTPTQVTFGTTDYAYNSMTVTGNTLVVPWAGVYSVDGLLKLSAAAGASGSGLELALYQNGSIARNVQQVGSNTVTLGGFDPIKCVAGDVLSLYLINATGSGVTISSASLSATLIATSSSVTTTAAGGSPSGSAGGSLGGTYPNPSIGTSVALPGSPTTTTQAAGDNSTKIATTAFVETSSSPGTPVYFVRTSGNDSNDGLTWGSAFASLTQAITALGGNKGVIQLGAGIFSAASYDLRGLKGVSISGMGDWGDASNGTVVRISSTGSSSGILLSRSRSITFAKLRIDVSNDTFSGTLVDCTDSSLVGGNTSYLSFQDCSIMGFSTSSNCNLVNLDGSHDIDFDRVLFQNAKKGVVGVNNPSNSFAAAIANTGAANRVSFRACGFQGFSVSSIHNPNFDWRIEATFEPLTNGKPIAITHDNITIASQAVTLANTSVNVLTCTNVGTTVTCTVDSLLPLQAGNTVTVAGISGFTTNNPNGTFTLASAVGTTTGVGGSPTITYTVTFVVSNAPTGSYSSGGTITSANTTITPTSMAGITVGMAVTGSSIPNSTYVTSVGGSTFTVNNPMTGATAAVLSNVPTSLGLVIDDCYFSDDNAAYSGSWITWGGQGLTIIGGNAHAAAGTTILTVDVNGSTGLNVLGPAWTGNNGAAAISWAGVTGCTVGAILPAWSGTWQQQLVSPPTGFMQLTTSGSISVDALPVGAGSSTNLLSTTYSKAITGCTNAGTTVTYTVSTTALLSVGTVINVASVSGFTTNNPNGIFTVTALTPTTITVVVANAPTGSYSSGGTITQLSAPSVTGSNANPTVALGVGGWGSNANTGSFAGSTAQAVFGLGCLTFNATGASASIANSNWVPVVGGQVHTAFGWLYQANGTRTHRPRLNFYNAQPFTNCVSTDAGTTWTLTVPNHGWTTNDTVTLFTSGQTTPVSVAAITVIDANTFKVTKAGAVTYTTGMAFQQPATVGSYLASGSFVTSTSGGPWTQSFVTATAPALANYAKVIFDINVSVNGDVYYAGGFQIAQGTSLAWSTSGSTAVPVGVTLGNSQSGFFGKSATQPTLTYSQSTETTAGTAIRKALSGVGLVNDLTTGTPGAVTAAVTSNAGTVPVTAGVANFTNSSAATMAITIATTGAIDGQQLTVRIYDFSAAAQTIGWTNTENSSVSAPTTSNGSTTLPRTVTFMYNSATSKWRCIASV